VGEANGVTVIDDYGHHPTEINAVLKAARVTFLSRRIVVLFQPHRYSRTMHLFDDFKKAFADSDLAILTDIYAAGEAPIDNISSAHLAIASQQAGFTQVRYGGSLDEATQLTALLLQPGDVVITLGAGSITHRASVLLDLVAKRHGQKHDT
jgi:UDP-N-acetylmuramate--alanine ligase